jgi:uroporphyrinogen decarboxylase
MLYEEPDFVHEMMETLCECMYRTAENAIERLGIRIDFASIWEDMAYNAGPLISPRQFEEFMVPRYKRVTGLLGRHGCNLTIVDCDGNIDALVPSWLKAGVNIMFPLEIRAGSDPYKYRRKYGREVLLLGGVDKMQLIRGKTAIDEELKRLEPLMRDGGFIPHVDHRVPPDVSYENYLYYLEQKKKYLGFQ